METMKHFSHKHPLVLSKYNNSPKDAFCRGCHDPVLTNTYAYHCIHRSISTQDSPCSRFFLHKTCANLPMMIQHHLQTDHMLKLFLKHGFVRCDICHASGEDRFIYVCTYVFKGKCFCALCLKCVSPERELNHPSHNHTLTLLPQKATLHICEACGMEGSKDFSYLCRTCLFWIHKNCASAPAQLIRKDHHNDHPLVLAYSLPREYQEFGVACSLCPESVYKFYWLYYCAECRYFAHVQCALSAAESGRHGNKSDDEGDAEGSTLVHFPASESETYLLYKLIQQFAKKCNTSTDKESIKADKISHCRNGHSLILFDHFNHKNVVASNTSDTRICNGCVQPLSSELDSFYGCLDCNFFLHSVCAGELPRELQHAFHPENKLIRCFRTSKSLDFYVCGLCDNYCNGIVYSDESNSYWVDIVCSALPSKIKHDSHRHSLELSDYKLKKTDCNGCGSIIYRPSFGCKKCHYYIHIKCALKLGTIKHRWDEHQLFLMYPPVKGHPHAFNCELCSMDINPNLWFCHCRKCDTSFHTRCIDQDEYSNIKYGGIVKDDNLHQHSLEITGTRKKFNCGNCGNDRFSEDYKWKPRLKCVSCKYSVCMDCITLRCGFIHESIKPPESKTPCSIL